MPLLRFPLGPTSLPRRGCASSPRCRGGASSLLRVGQPTQSFAPVARAWATRMAVATARNLESA
jgi:hypothetical protein